METLDFFDAVCSDITVYTRQSINHTSINHSDPKIASQVYAYPLTSISHQNTVEEIVRILPRQNGIYSETSISDRTRYAFDGFKNQRASLPSTIAFSNNNINYTGKSITSTGNLSSNS